MIDAYDILETISMIREEHLDIRTVTMGINLLDCAADDIAALSGRVYDKITTRAEGLVKACDDISKEYGIPIINKRVSVTPVSLFAASCGAKSYVPLAAALDRAAAAVGIDFIGGFSSLVHKGFTDSDRVLLASIPEALAATQRVCSSVNTATTKAGTNMDAVRKLGDIILETARLTRHGDSIGCAKFVAFANVPEDNPFMAGAFHGVTEPECVVSVGVSGPGVVRSALARAGDCDMTQAADIIKKTAFKITRAGQLVAKEASRRLNVPFGIVDLSLAPTPKVGDSVARILEEIGLEVCGGCGTTACLALLNDAVKKGGLMASSHVGGLSGAFIPVSEDEGMISAAEKGALSIEKLEAMTAVCSVGLDMIAVPGDTPADVISAIIADEMAIGVVNNKTTAVRVIPAFGKKTGDRVDFGGLLGGAPVMAVHTGSPARFIARGGRIPAPLQSLRN